MTVYLVGAGPGDPDLLTLRAAKLLAEADVVVVDRLVGRRILALIRRDTLVIDVSKRPGSGDPEADQASINATLVEHGRRGVAVVRLKGGDPFVFGRGGEELEALDAAGVAVEVVPGITSAFALPALAGIPVTARGVASAVSVLSGHDVASLVAASGSVPQSTTTLVLLMAVANRGVIAKELMAAGRPRDTPVAVIERGATPLERRIATTLGHLGDEDVEAPAVIVVGSVAARIRTNPGASTERQGPTMPWIDATSQR